MISSPLFISVAESMVIFAPIFQVGCLSASSTVMLANFSGGHSRNGPPEAVSKIRWTSPRLWPTRHWKTALCSESTGSSATPARPGGRGHQAAGHHQRLLVGQRQRACPPRSRPWSAAARRRPRAPRRPRRPPRRGTARPGPRRRPAARDGGPAAAGPARRAALGSSSATACGVYLRHRSAIRSTFEPRAARPSTENSSEKLDTSSSVRSPIEPVAPRIVTRFMRTPRPARGSRRPAS